MWHNFLGRVKTAAVRASQRLQNSALSWCRAFYEAAGGDATVALVQQALTYLFVALVVVVVVALLVLASIGISFLLAFATRTYVLYDLPVSSVHEISDWTAVPRTTEPWRQLQDLNSALVDAASSLGHTAKDLRIALEGVRDDGANFLTVPAREVGLSLHGKYLEARLKKAEAVAESLVATALVRIQPTGWRTRNTWNVPVDVDTPRGNPSGAGGEGVDSSSRRGPTWFVNDDALFLPQGPRFSQTASYSGSVRIVAACPDGGRGGALLTATAAVLIAEDDMPQQLPTLTPLFSRSRGGFLLGQGMLVYFARWVLHMSLYVPLCAVDWVSSVALWWANVDAVSRSVNELGPDECLLDLQLYHGFAPPKDLLQRLRVINLTIASSSTEPNVLSAPLQLRRMYFMHDVEHFGLAYYFSEYPILSLWVATIVWFSVCVSFVVAGAITVAVLSYQYKRGDADGDESLVEVRDEAPRRVVPSAMPIRGRARHPRQRNDWASGDEEENSADDAEQPPAARSQTVSPPPPPAPKSVLRKRAVSVR